MRGIVVGVDGSDVSRRALRWALDDAERRGADVEVVHVYDTAALYYSEASIHADLGKLADRVREDAEDLVGGMVAAALAGRGDLSVTPVAIDAPNPAGVLTDRAAEADLLVVGTRGHGGFAGLLLGSVSHQCVSHPPCPVTVVPYRA